LAATVAAGVPETVGVVAAVPAPDTAAALSVEPASLDPPQPARATVRVRTARAWLRIPQLFSLFMSLASLSGENP